jgi:hypothetical protein
VRYFGPTDAARSSSRAGAAAANLRRAGKKKLLRTPCGTLDGITLNMMSGALQNKRLEQSLARIHSGDGSSGFTGGRHAGVAGVVVVPPAASKAGRRLPLEGGLVRRVVQPDTTPSVVPAHASRWREREACRIERENNQLYQTLTECAHARSAIAPKRLSRTPFVALTGGT